jgi:hypothetical protein
VELVLVGFEVAQLGELLVTFIQTAFERLELLMNNLVGADIAPLGKRLAANIAAIRALTSVTALVGLEVA